MSGLLRRRNLGVENLMYGPSFPFLALLPEGEHIE
jgi:hypothetical protein